MRRQDITFILPAMVCSFLIAFEYAISRPASNAFFVSLFGPASYPYAWLFCVPLNFLVVSCYSRFLPKWGCASMMRLVASAVMLGNLCTYLLVDHFPAALFLHYLWKDIYILLMFKQLWSLIHSRISMGKARYLYGLFFGVGGLGSVLGSSLPSSFAVSLGSKIFFLAAIPIYLTFLFFYALAWRSSRGSIDLSSTSSTSIRATLSQIARKPFLFYILLLVVCMQLSVALVEYQFNCYLKASLPHLDLRTEYCGRLFGIINFLTTSFQLFGGFLLIESLGLALGHRMIPFLFLLQGASFFFFPSFAMISVSLVSVKSMDHSLFGILREMLYIPLGAEEKFQVKAVIDVFAYRSAKAFAAIFLILGQKIIPLRILPVTGIAALSIFAFWLWVTYKMFHGNTIWTTNGNEHPTFSTASEERA
ncbi:MAG: Npt1/Npt2 family nucleotide transporter [Chlamydiota bacterium]